MKRIITIFLLMLSFAFTASAQSDYDIRRARSYQREAEYYCRQADGYRRDADYYLRRARSYQLDVDYYTRHKNYERARTYAGYVSDMMEKYKTRMQWAVKADEKAAMYMKWASEALSKK